MKPTTLHKVTVLMAALSVGGCETYQVYTCPYPAKEVEQAEKLASAITRVSVEEMTPYCGRPTGPGLVTGGCFVPETDTILLLDELPGWMQEQILHHEYCHLYEHRVLGLQGTAHEGWIQ